MGQNAGAPIPCRKHWGPTPSSGHLPQPPSDVRKEGARPAEKGSPIPCRGRVSGRSPPQPPSWEPKSPSTMLGDRLFHWNSRQMTPSRKPGCQWPTATSSRLPPSPAAKRLAPRGCSQCTGDRVAPEPPRAGPEAGWSPRPGGQGQSREVASAVGGLGTGPVLHPPPCAPSLCILPGPHGGPSDL